MTIYLVRHALAVPRKEWDRDDDLRPLTKRGERQAAGLADRFRDDRIDVIYSSPAVRCVDTVRPIAAARGLAVEAKDLLAEGRGADAVELVDRNVNVMLCAHGDNLPEILVALAGDLDDVPAEPPYAKGATWVLRVDGGRISGATYVEPPA